MTPLDLSPPKIPTIVEVWAPHCAECNAMQPHLDAEAAEFSGTVDLVKVNAVSDPARARQLGVLGTPTLIGFRDGAEVFRFTGRRSRGELRELFAAVSDGNRLTGVGTQDLVLRAGAGVVMIGVGLLLGPAWPILAIGAAATAFGTVPWLQRLR
ncbi:MAG: thioredoxin family protein [Acidimicrobiia bacterium]|nr:thioredoxin family protein [Acidimicrobiia bacterium]NNF88500.1 thioredoxin family protein [Acidimicrobiia bacterium]NNL12440.1 thioredoxin family protein [Acidimicrobiia bacterium]NNL68741.1 thioredoxin family protein [Acidimicrobiia bacterium]